MNFMCAFGDFSECCTQQSIVSMVYSFFDYNFFFYRLFFLKIFRTVSKVFLLKQLGKATSITIKELVSNDIVDRSMEMKTFEKLRFYFYYYYFFNVRQSVKLE